MKFLLDTETIGYIINNKYPSVRKHLENKILLKADIAISVVSETDLLYRINHKKSSHILKQALQDFLNLVTILPWDSKAAKAYVQISFLHENKGITPPLFDMLIAAHALAENRVLISSSPLYPALNITTENWTA